MKPSRQGLVLANGRRLLGQEKKRGLKGVFSFLGLA
jgi:hypothetical protein